ncbi:hypothetical protein [Pseudoalteromonas sp. McH1-42]|uniref:hypothetical protein n=1 Tax=Pseudoalteromonas sp. McH1-42 TaxID=2917752 RepID=UPI001EF5658D|nr:hypothetical protein [Pseudoalteromonas sp. McH1-42]MCG7562399.1 hypothetical protein [Pseudoalteromonas sp. McH1-42]
MSQSLITTDDKHASHTVQHANSALPMSFYVKWLWAIGLLILLGFIPSYVLQFSSLTEAHHSHASVSFLWIAGMLVQVTLIHYQRYTHHRILGYLSTCVLLAFVLSTLSLYANIIQTQFNTSTIFRLVLSLDLVLFPAFILFMYKAILRTDSPHAHAHWILLAAMMLLPPGLGRLIHGLFFFPFDAPVRFFYEPTVVLTGLFIYSIGRAQRWHFKSTKACLVLFIAAVIFSYGVGYGF